MKQLSVFLLRPLALACVAGSLSILIYESIAEETARKRTADALLNEKRTAKARSLSETYDHEVSIQKMKLKDGSVYFDRDGTINMTLATIKCECENGRTNRNFTFHWEEYDGKLYYSYHTSNGDNCKLCAKDAK